MSTTTIATVTERRTPRDDAARELRRMVDMLEGLTPEERERLIREESVDEEPA